jgi:hypothetical protein
MFMDCTIRPMGERGTSYLPLPVQQGCVPQIGVPNGDTDPAGSQQQQPLQSVHAAFVLSGLHSELQAEPPDPLEVDPLDPLPPAPLLAEPLLFPPLLAEPLLLAPLLAEPLLLAPPLAEPLLLAPLLAEPLLLAPLLADPLTLLLPSSPPSAPLEEPPVPLVLSLQAASPTVDEAPITTTAWNKRSILMAGSMSLGKRRCPHGTVSTAEARTSHLAAIREPDAPIWAEKWVASISDGFLQSSLVGCNKNSRRQDFA